MSDKQFTSKRVYTLIFVIMVGIAFMETPASAAIWTWKFLQVFLLNIIEYSMIAVFVAILFSSFLHKD